MMFITPQMKEHPLEYVALGAIFLTGLVLFLVFAADPHSERRVVYATTAAYLFWSLFHHYRRGDLHPSIVIEYLLMALFALVLISTTVF